MVLWIMKKIGLDFDRVKRLVGSCLRSNDLFTRTSETQINASSGLSKRRECALDYSAVFQISSIVFDVALFNRSYD